MITLKSGRFGPYVTDGTTNASLRRGDSEEDLTLGAGGRAARRAPRRTLRPAPRGRRGATAKKAPAKKAAAKKAAAKKAPAKKAAAKKAAAKKAPAKRVASGSEALRRSAVLVPCSRHRGASSKVAIVAERGLLHRLRRRGSNREVDPGEPAEQRTRCAPHPRARRHPPR